MRRHAKLIVAAAVVALVLAGCQMPLSTNPGDAVADTETASLPPDEVRDVPRSVTGPFTFETLYSVALRLEVDLYETDENGAIVGEPLPDGSVDVFVQLDDSEGNPVFSGMLSDEGTLYATVQLPSAAEDMSLTVRAAGFEPRTIVVDDMAEFELIDRTLSLARLVPGSAGPASRSTTAASDRDGDGVSDAEDKAPDDPNVAFYAYVPSREAITIAFEDLFGRARAGDADYNDFIASYSIVEGLNADLNVTEITVEAEAVQKLAGYDHRFGIRFDAFAGEAKVSGTYIDLRGREHSYTGQPVTGPAELDLFVNSRYAKGATAGFTVTFDEPQVRDEDPETLPAAPYNPYLFVYNTGHDIHRPDHEANTHSINPGDPFMDADGFPWALLVPREWDHPEEGVRIEVDYPRFTLWRESGGTEYQDWYDPSGGTQEDVTVHVAGYYKEGTSKVAAYWVDDGETISLVDLNSSADAEATDVVVGEDGLVHASGWSDADGVDVAVYWRGSTRIDLDSDARATGIAVGGDGVAYLSGSYLNGEENMAAYWTVDGDVVRRYDLEPDSRSTATGIDLGADGAVYVSGHYDGGSYDIAAYWRAVGDAVEREDLYPGGSSLANAIDRADGVTYVAGRYLSGGVFAAYWVDNAAGLVTLDGTPGSARGIVRLATGTAVAGDYLNADTVRQAAVWESTSPTELSTTVSGASTYAYGVAAHDGVVYATGSQASGSDRAVYWRGTELVALSPLVESRANAVVVRP